MRVALSFCLVFSLWTLTACDADVGVPDPSVPCGDTSCTAPQVCVSGKCVEPVESDVTDTSTDATSTVADVAADVTALVDTLQDTLPPKDTSGPVNPFVTACLTAKCTNEIAACTGTCATWLTCAKGCEATDFTCQNSCGKATTGDAKGTQQQQKVLICFSTNAASCKPAPDATTGEVSDAKDGETSVTTPTLPDWLLPDSNPNSPTLGKKVGPNQWPGQNVIIAMVAGYSAASLALVDTLSQVSASTNPPKFKTIYVVDPSQPDPIYTHTNAPVAMDLWSNHTATLPDGTVLTAGKHDMFGYDASGRLVGYFQGGGSVAYTSVKTFAVAVGNAPAGSKTYFVSCPGGGLSGCKTTK